MAKQAIALRLTPETLGKLDTYAKSRNASRQQVLEAAVDAFLGDAERGVPDLPVVDTPEVRQARAKVNEVQRPAQRPRDVFADPNGTRQQRLNAQMLRSRGQK